MYNTTSISHPIPYKLRCRPCWRRWPLNGGLVAVVPHWWNLLEMGPLVWWGKLFIGRCLTRGALLQKHPRGLLKKPPAQCGEGGHNPPRSSKFLPPVLPL